MAPFQQVNQVNQEVSHKGQIREMRSVGPRSWEAKMVGLGRLELPTSRLSSARSNQLSYKPQAQAPNHKPLNSGRRAPTDIRPNTGKLARARPGRKRNEGGEVPHVRPYRPVVPSDR